MDCGLVPPDDAVDWERLAKRLLGAGQLGVSLQGADGHIWIHEAEVDHCLSDALRPSGVQLDGKIYGGILEALDMIDVALAMSGAPVLLELYSDQNHFLGEGGVDETRIERGEPGDGVLC